MDTTKKMMHQVIDYQKTLVDTSFDMISTLQEQSCHVMDMIFEKNVLIPESSRKMCTYWTDLISQNRKNCRQFIDSSFDRVKAFCVEETVPPSAPAAPPAAAPKAKASAKSE